VDVELVEERLDRLVVASEELEPLERVVDPVVDVHAAIVNARRARLRRGRRALACALRGGAAHRRCAARFVAFGFLICWDRAAPRYEECWTDTGFFVEPLLDAAGVRAGTRLLDLACGPGFVSEAAAERGAEPVGLDVAPGMIEQARRRNPGLTFVCYADGDGFTLPIVARVISASPA
jgi:2-polyprenyl-3-methyl-5-hydroxy-6-metoxy-1,4-benzoquinol methylase